ncbi:MAG TPA: cyclic nucleotide-binding domain-containing protein [bacterium]|nr:cyclic nucleotide-binding domain-containing protein [bacterium]
MPTHESGTARVALLEKLLLFGGLSPRELGRIARLMREIDVPTGKRLVTLGEPGREMFLIVEGRALVTTQRGRAVHLGRGDFFGEMSLIDGEPRSATVEAATPMRLLTLGYREFWQLLDESLPMVRKIMRTVARRLRQVDRAPVV